jgi:uracil-DNA glycosylase family protein
LPEKATQVVWGEGPAHAPLVMVGEQPGDEEDRAGRPFVGPAGRLLDEMLEKVGLDRTQAYVTNAVKHFKWEPRGKRRLHSKPNRDEIDACHGWMRAELELVQPKMILCLGATAAQSFAGAKFRVQRDRGKPMATPWAPWWMATYHPSALLRAPDPEARQRMAEEFLADLALARDHLRSLHAA